MGFDPVSLAIMGVGAAASMAEQSSAAQNQADAQAARNRAQVNATIENYKELDKAEGDVVYNSAQDALDLQVQGLQAKAQAEAMASATGIRGRSSDFINSDLDRQISQGNTDLAMAQQQQLNNISAQAESLRIGTKANLDHTPIQKPSVLQAVSTGASLASAFAPTATKVTDAKRDFSKVNTGGKGGK